MPEEIVFDAYVDGPEGEQTTYLVNGDGKLVYYFFPHGAHDYELAGDWPEPTHSWARLWEPVLVDMAGRLTAPTQIPTALKDEVLSGVERKGEGTYQVNWGGDKTIANGDVRAFWRLYTYKYDLPLKHYAMHAHRYPPGLVKGLWEAANVTKGAPSPSSSERLDAQGGPVGDNVTGGP